MYLLSEKGQKQIDSFQAGGNRQGLNFGQIRSFVLPVPPLHEQQAIAAALSDVDVLIASLDTLIAKKRAIKQGAMQELLTGKRRLLEFTQEKEYKKTEVGIIPTEWKVSLFGEVVSIRNEKFDPIKTSSSFFCVELEHIGQGNGELIGGTKAGVTSSIKNRFQKGDVLFGKLRAYLRKYWLADRDGVCSTEIWPLIANKASL